jgi:hypothetical protein
LGLLGAVLVAGVPLLIAAADPRAPAVRVFAGKVMPLAGVLAKDGVQLDRDAEPVSLILAGDDGKYLPLVKDAGSRMFFKDKQLLNRPMRLTGRLVAGGSVLQVLSVRSVVNGKLHEPYYWCDICAIKRGEPNDCDCCGAPLVFREVPVEK